jgi:hypothetical protein
VTNTLAYYDMVKITTIKCFTVQAPVIYTTLRIYNAHIL